MAGLLVRRINHEPEYRSFDRTCMRYPVRSGREEGGEVEKLRAR